METVSSQITLTPIGDLALMIDFRVHRNLIHQQIDFDNKFLKGRIIIESTFALVKDMFGLLNIWRKED